MCFRYHLFFLTFSAFVGQVQVITRNLKYIRPQLLLVIASLFNQVKNVGFLEDAPRVKASIDHLYHFP